MVSMIFFVVSIGPLTKNTESTDASLLVNIKEQFDSPISKEEANRTFYKLSVLAISTNQLLTGINRPLKINGWLVGWPLMTIFHYFL